MSVVPTAGALRHRIEIDTPGVTSQNSFGEDVVAWTSLGSSFPCLVEPLAGKELEMAMQRWAQAKYQITMRHQPGLTFSAKMRAIWQGRHLNILNVNDPGENNPWITMIAEDYDDTSVT